MDTFTIYTMDEHIHKTSTLRAHTFIDAIAQFMMLHCLNRIDALAVYYTGGDEYHYHDVRVTKNTVFYDNISGPYAQEVRP